jgi:poly-gamma-glutamate synthesis protein (capsule biosynthesis protein)
MKIALIGDIAFFGKFDITKNPSIKEYFSSVAAYLKGFDYVIGNFETPLSVYEKSFGHKSAYIKSHPANIELLSYLNIGVVNLANNHIFDYGKEGYNLTIKLLEESNIKFFGIEGVVEFLESSESKIALHGYCCYSTNPIVIHNGVGQGINMLDVNNVSTNLKKFNDLGYYNIISVHAGQEHVNYPNYDHVLMARQLSQMNSYVYFGHHPHVMQGIEKINDALIAYSLGNFCFDDVYTPKSKKPLIKQSENNKSAIILSLEISNEKLVNYKTIGIYAGDKELIINHEKSIIKLNEYSDKLSIAPSAYISKRNELLNNYIASRKSMRNFNWYLKRLNIRYALMLLDAIKNKKLYTKHVLNQLS